MLTDRLRTADRYPGPGRWRRYRAAARWAGPGADRRVDDLGDVRDVKRVALIAECPGDLHGAVRVGRDHQVSAGRADAGRRTATRLLEDRVVDGFHSCR